MLCHPTLHGDIGSGTTVNTQGGEIYNPFGLFPVAVCKALVKRSPQDPQPESRDPSEEEKQNRVCVKSKS